jgi:hypothetical protein
MPQRLALEAQDEKNKWEANMACAIRGTQP